MMKMNVDMHIHSSRGIGDKPIEKIFTEAKKQNLQAISITDLDTLDAYHETSQSDADFYELKLIRGVEIGASEPRQELLDIRLLAYNFLLHHRGLNNLLKKNYNYRYTPGRPRNAGWGGGLASVREVAQQVKSAGGMTFLDPSSISVDIGAAVSKMELMKLIPQFKAWGVDGIEIANGRITPQESEFLSGLAGEHKMAKIIGSGYVSRKATPDISIGKCEKEQKLSQFVLPPRTTETVQPHAHIPQTEMGKAVSLYEEPKFLSSGGQEPTVDV